MMNSLATSDLEALPLETLVKIFGFLKKTPWKLPLGQCSKVLYQAFAFHIEKRKAYILRSRFGMRFAANWGDPILTQVPLTSRNFDSHMFAHLCKSGNLELVRYVNTSLFLEEECDRLAIGSVLQRYRTAAKALLRFNTLTTEDSQIPIETINGVLSYFMETLSDDGQSRNRFIQDLAGVIQVYGQDTCLRSLLRRECMEQANIYQERRTQSKIIQEYFYAGDVVGGLACDMSIFNDGTLCEVFRRVVHSALCSPRENKEAIFAAWNAYIDHCSPCAKDIKNLLKSSLSFRKGKLFWELIGEHIAQNHIELDLQKIWIKSTCRNKEYVELWNLDAKNCLLRILTSTKTMKTFSILQGMAFSHLLKHFPNLLHNLNRTTRKSFQHLGLYCPKCLTLKVNRSYDGCEHQCNYCKHRWPSNIHIKET
uniref:Uncharacterized protein n=1 Tax=Pithovirus LCPAC304 TaxID=2506594 RepID=A0A481Z8R1_9VIRU|nr:MAG: hypothetical protein LCPAC304_06250 [Pithovirus LCPAC304]